MLLINMVVAVTLTILIAAFKFITAPMGREPSPATRVITALRANIRVLLFASIAVLAVEALSRKTFLFCVFHTIINLRLLFNGFSAPPIYDVYNFELARPSTGIYFSAIAVSFTIETSAIL